MALTRSLRPLAFALALGAAPAMAQTTLLNVSYDPTRELYAEVNPAFAAFWKDKTGEEVEIRMSHGGSGKQARSVIDGLPADVVSLAISVDIDAIAEKTGKIPADWRSRLPDASSPYTSTIVFLVRKGNPKEIADWDDLAREDVAVITPNPKTSGGARWNYLAAWIWAQKEFAGDAAKIEAYVGALYRNVPVLDTGARGSTLTFTQRGIGDVLLAWENEAYLSLDELGEDAFEIVVPSISILAEPPVALVPANAEANGTTRTAQAYLDFLYSETGQKLAARHHYRPAKPELADPEHMRLFPDVERVRVEDVFGSWSEAQATHFSDGGVFDRLYRPGN
ncbi:sulfate ABC transporter substrate-binding protein [Albimonas pacifica]|uniref:Sulfate transport system substrate-binding protein n=1 Tax=Albimonas pacifica TaxID=1114924 RepID=A0A1I3NC90_9RHOB|nr:sulfate ABC transporter substrate-binding protein [Albimonas pacifica]SFJ06520.1 sulfate transport system substrate-binding protein [Albimonas pacifica]